MTYIEQYDIYPTSTFKQEIQDFYRYLAIKLNEPNIANNFYKKITRKIYTLRYLPTRCNSLRSLKQIDRDIRKLLVDKYIIIYEIKKDTRSSISLTYFSF